MVRPFNGVIRTDIKDSVPDWQPFIAAKAPQDAPNIIYIVLDDVGFSATQPYGGPIETPNLNRLAERRLTTPISTPPHCARRRVPRC